VIGRAWLLLGLMLWIHGCPLDSELTLLRIKTIIEQR
jgi:hypothetical protein